VAPLNFVTPSNFTLTIGGVDFTKCIAAFSIQRPLPEPKTPQTWQGSITLAYPVTPAYIPESLDPAINPNGRWEIGCHQILLRFGTTRLCPPLYVMGYRWNDQTRTAEIEVGDDLTLRSDFTPPQDYTKLGLSAVSGATVAGLVERACLSVGLTNYSVTGLAASIPVSPDKNEGSWIEWAQGYTGERGYWLYMHTDGQVRLRNYPFSNTPVLLTRPRSQVETFDPIFVDTPKDRYVCSGTGEQLVPSGTPTTTTVDEEFGDLIYYDTANPPNTLVTTALVRRTTTSIVQSGITFFRKTVVTQEALGAIDPQLFPGNTSAVTTSSVEETHYARSSGEVYQIVSTTLAPLPRISSEMNNLVDESIRATNPSPSTIPGLKLPYWQSFAPAALTTIETFDDGGVLSSTRGMVITRTKNSYGYRRTNKLSYAYGLLVEAESETYTPDRIVLSNAANPPTTHYTKRLVRSIRPESFKKTQVGATAATWLVRALNPAEIDTQTGQTPPSFPTLQAPYETGSVQFSGTATFTPASASPYYTREEQVSADTLVSGSECQFYARLIGTLAHQSYRGRSTNLPIPSEWLADPKPFQVVAIHDGLFVTCNDQITLSNDGIELSWQLYRIGYLSTPVPETGSWTPASPTVPYTVATPTVVTGFTPSVNWTAPAGSWYKGLATVKTGTTPVINWTVDSTGYKKINTGATPVIDWTVPAGEYTGGGGGY